MTNLYIENNDLTAAEMSSNRSSLLQAKTENGALKASFKLCYARILDNKGKYIEAAREYNTISHDQSVHEDQRLIALNNAFITTVLTSSGVRRMQMLVILFKDERCRQLSFYSILKKMYLCHIIRPGDVTILDSMLHSYQKNRTVDDLSILKLAVAEHNMLAISKLYKNIKIVNLAYLANIEPIKAERIIGSMISEGRLIGTIDQVDNFVYFQTRKNIVSWDQQIKSLCLQVNRMFEVLYNDPPTRDWMDNYYENQANN